ncbi:MAG: phosphonate C-P lyase system protein PhnH [Anaerolineae bacterium]
MPTHPPYTPSEALARETFLALMWSLSYPGRIHTLPDSGPPFESIAHALLDLETTFYTPEAALANVLAHNGARAFPPETAAYHFYPAVTDLASIRAASVGTLLYPDRSATLFVDCTLNADDGDLFILTGPGINGETRVRVAGLPREFWAIREQRCRFPLGWDVYLIDQSRVIGLPRSTKMLSVAHDAR